MICCEMLKDCKKISTADDSVLRNEGSLYEKATNEANAIIEKAKKESEYVIHDLRKMQQEKQRKLKNMN